MFNNSWNLQTIEDYKNELTKVEKEYQILAIRTAQLESNICNLKDENTRLKRRIKALDEVMLETTKTKRDYKYISVKLENIRLNQMIQELKQMRHEQQSLSTESLD